VCLTAGWFLWGISTSSELYSA